MPSQFIELKSIFESYMQEQLFNKDPKELYDPVNYILQLPAKRFRPVSLLMAFQLFRKDLDRALPAALGIEIFHNFSLVHDDMMDEATMRRGHQPVHIKYGINSGILSGDVMLIQSYHYLLIAASRSSQLGILEEMTKAAIHICDGQQYDMNFEDRLDVNVSEYIQMIKFKTAVLLGASMKIGGMLGGASAEQSNLLYDFGRILGIAFQIQDDVLDVFGNPNKVGKIAGGDIRQNKKTYLYVAALEKLSGRRKEELMYLFDTDALQDESKVTRVIDLYNAAGVRQRAEKYQQKLYESALDKLNQLQEDRLITGPLEELASTLYKRHK